MSDDPVPAYFSWRYILWLIWSNMVTILAVVQSAVASLMLLADDTSNAILTHAQFRYVVLANAVLTAIVAQVKKQNPPGPPPMKESKSVNP